MTAPEEVVQGDRPTHLGASALFMLFAAVVAAVTWSHFDGGFFCSSEVHHGANIEQAFGVAFLSGLATPVALFVVRRWQRLARAVLLLGAAALLAAIVLVTVDSAHYAAVRYCGLFSGTTTRVDEGVYYLYFLWGIPLGFLVWASDLRIPRRRQPEGESRTSGPARRRFAWLAVVVAVIGLAGWGAIESASGRSTSTGQLAGAARVDAMFKGIPQRGMTLGSTHAPVTLVAYIELQCPYCQDFETHVLPGIVKRYVATGKVKIEARPLDFLGPDSTRGRNAMIAAGTQNRAFNFAELLYLNQGEEDSGWLNDEMVARTAKSIPGLNPRELFAAPLRDVKRQAERFDREGSQVQGTPTLLVGRSGRQGQEVDADTRALEHAIEIALHAH